MKRILVTGAAGQIGSELVDTLRERYGEENVVATDIIDEQLTAPCEVLDVLDYSSFKQFCSDYKVDTLIHLAAILSATAEEKPKAAWDLNMNGLLNSLEVAKELKLQYFTPSSIGAFSEESGAKNTAQFVIQRPTSMYGITKVAGELLCDYYHRKYGVDTRSVRFPGLISSKTQPGGGTTDYAVEIYYAAIQGKQYVCPLKEDTYLDMMYIDDAINAIIDLMEVEQEKLSLRNAYNVSAISMSPQMVTKSIQKQIPDFKISYEIDPIKQAIADSWPDAMDCSVARKDWNFRCHYGLDEITEIMLTYLEERLK